MIGININQKVPESLQENLLANVLVSPIADFSGPQGTTNKETLLNRVEQLSKEEQNFLSNELDRIINIEKQNKKFSENGVGLLLIDGFEKKSKLPLFSILISSESKSIVDRVGDARKMILSKNIIKEKEVSVDREFIIKCLKNVESNLTNTIMEKAKEKEVVIESVIELNGFVRKIKNEKFDDSTKEVMRGVAKIFKSDKTDQSKKMHALLSAALIGNKLTIEKSIKKNVSESDLLYLKKLNSYNSEKLIESVIFEIVSKSVFEKISILQSELMKINDNIAPFNMMLKRVEKYKKRDVLKSKDESILKAQEALSSTEIFISSIDNMISSVANCKFFTNFETELKCALEFIYSGLDSDCVFKFNNQEFSLFNIAKSLDKSIREMASEQSNFIDSVLNFSNCIRQEIKTDNLNNLEKKLLELKELLESKEKMDSDEMMENTDTNVVSEGKIEPREETSSQKVQENLQVEVFNIKEDVLDPNADSNDDLSKKMELCKTVLSYLNELFLVINQELIKSLEELIKSLELTETPPNIEKKVLAEICFEQKSNASDKKNQKLIFGKENEIEFKDNNNISNNQVNNSAFLPNNINNQVNNPMPSYNSMPSHNPSPIASITFEMVGNNIQVPHGDNFEDRKALALILSEMQQDPGIANRSYQMDGIFRSLERNPLTKSMIYGNFYFIMKEQGRISEEGKKHYNWGERVFMKWEGWESLVNVFDTTQQDWTAGCNWQTLNVRRTEALKLAVQGIKRDY